MPLAVAWTGSSWKALVLDGDKLVVQRLDTGLNVKATDELAVDAAFIRPPTIVADAHRAVIAVATADGQTLTQVCY